MVESVINPPQVRRSEKFFDNLSVAQRIYALVLIPLLLLTLIGSGAIFALNQNQLVLSELRDRVDLIEVDDEIRETVQKDFINLMYEVAMSTVTWDQGALQLARAEEQISKNLLPAYKGITENLKRYSKKDTGNASDSPVKSIEAIEELLKAMQRGLEILRKRDRADLELYLQNHLSTEVMLLTSALNQRIKQDLDYAHTSFNEASGNAKRFLVLAIILILVGMSLAALLGYSIYRSIARQVAHLTGTIRDISAGDLNARVNLLGASELAELGQAFDGMVEQRIATQRKINADHQQLNASVFALLEAVADLSERNLSVRAKVTEDATGPLADAINQLAEDTSDVLKQVREVANLVENAAQDVNQHALSVSRLSAVEREQAEETSEQLDAILQRFDAIAEAAQRANTMATNTSNATKSAQSSVVSTVDSIAGIRDTVQETGKRLKRLGERSQEISRIVDLIGGIAERTTVLALNASMQATAAGEAGRGFSVIAEEIQHLAQSSRESTDQIGVIVRNIQQEANTTISTMDQTISEVVTGSQLAEQAAGQMQLSLNATLQLVGAVDEIASDSREQVKTSQTLRERAERILESTQATGKELLSLTALTRNMTDYAQRLVQAVNVFRLER